MSNQTKIYVSTYAKYNNGSLSGAWVCLNDFADPEGFLAHCRELHDDETDPELMFQDVDTDSAFIRELIGESHIDDEIFEAMEAIESTHLDADAINAYIGIFGKQDTIADTIADAEDRYYGEWDSDEDFAENMAEETGSIDRDAKWPMNCIDWQHAARELMWDFSEQDGHYFRA